MTQPYQIEVQGMAPHVNEKVAQALSIIFNLEVKEIEQKTLIYQVMILKLLERLMAQTVIHNEDFRVTVSSSMTQHLADNPLSNKRLGQAFKDSGINLDDLDWEESKTFTKDQQLPKTDDSEEKIH